MVAHLGASPSEANDFNAGIVIGTVMPVSGGFTVGSCTGVSSAGA
jgi:hypothetical protein